MSPSPSPTQDLAAETSLVAIGRVGVRTFIKETNNCKWRPEGKPSSTQEQFVIVKVVTFIKLISMSTSIPPAGVTAPGPAEEPGGDSRAGSWCLGDLERKGERQVSSRGPILL